jgi:hypothetical protein
MGDWDRQEGEESKKAHGTPLLSLVILIMIHI